MKLTKEIIINQLGKLNLTIDNHIDHIHTDEAALVRD
jgi:hypothetical protein